MNSDTLSLGDQWRIFHEEGLPSLQNRNKAAAEEAKRVKKLTALTERDGRVEIGADHPLVLNVTYLPPAFDRLANHTQFFDRLEEEKQIRTVALAYPSGDSWHLEVWTKTSAGIMDLGETTNPVEIIAKAARHAGSRHRRVRLRRSANQGTQGHHQGGPFHETHGAPPLGPLQEPQGPDSLIFQRLMPPMRGRSGSR